MTTADTKDVAHRVTPGECLDLLHSTFESGATGLFSFERLIDLIVSREENGSWT